MNTTQTDPETTTKAKGEAARQFALSQGYNEMTANAFSLWLKDYKGVITSMRSLFDYYMISTAE